jgi:transposase
MDLCILNQAGEMLVHRHMPAAPDPVLKTIAPSREDVVVCVECLVTWYWLADRWAQEGVPFVLGHALSMKAIPGGKAKHDTIDAQKIAALLRGGMLPQADVYPAAMRATRDLLRRRMQLARTRAERLAHVQHTNSQDHLPAIGQKIADKANRDGVAERWADPAVHKSIDVDLALISDDDERLREVELTLRNTATHHDTNTLSLLQTVPGIGTILRLVWLYEIHAINRFPTVQDVVSYGRLVTCAKESAGKRWGTSGAKSGKAHLTWAFSEAAVLFRRDHPPAQTSLARLEKNQDQGKALTVLAHQLARAVYDLLKRHVAFDKDQFFHHSWRGADEPGASLDTPGMNLPDALDTAASRASLNAQARIGRDPLSPAR